jgi:hypothetical protein
MSASRTFLEVRKDGITMKLTGFDKLIRRQSTSDNDCWTIVHRKLLESIFFYSLFGDIN